MILSQIDVLTFINCCRAGCETWRFVTRDNIVTQRPSHYLPATIDLLPLRFALKKL